MLECLKVDLDYLEEAPCLTYISAATRVMTPLLAAFGFTNLLLFMMRAQ
jgi:hypothetical protein